MGLSQCGFCHLLLFQQRRLGYRKRKAKDDGVRIVVRNRVRNDKHHASALKRQLSLLHNN